MNAEDYKKLLRDNHWQGSDDPDIVAKMNSMTDAEIDLYCVYELGIADTNGEREIVDLWYDEWEKFNGDGYYLLTKPDSPCDKRATHVFQNDGLYWEQMSGDTIRGLDGDSGVELLGILNSNGAKCIGIKNMDGKTLYPKVRAPVATTVPARHANWGSSEIVKF